MVRLSIRPAQRPLHRWVAGGTLEKEVHLRLTSWAWPEPYHPALLALGSGMNDRAGTEGPCRYPRVCPLRRGRVPSLRPQGAVGVITANIRSVGP